MAKKSKKSITNTVDNASSGTAVATPPRATSKKSSSTAVVMPTYEQISQRAQEIWVKKGCLPGQDEQNWLEAERQLIAELPGR